MSGLAATNPAVGSSGAVGGSGGRVGGRAVTRAGGQVPPSVYVLGGLATLGFVALFYRWLVKQAQISTSQLEDWGHALVIPAIAGWILWQKRAMLSREPIRAFWPGLAAMLLGIVCYMFFVVGVPNHMLQG
ncbi:MAG: hypothetical protein KDA05_09090, partial [Phycisphaerales bacterium]|nr:hypothetical protein [Phycisphaerales bacterium]